MNRVNEVTPCAHHPFTVRCNSTPEITIPPWAFGMPRLAPPLLQGHWGGGTTFTSMEACLEVLHSSAGADNWLTHLQSLFSSLPALLMSTTENVCKSTDCVYIRNLAVCWPIGRQQLLSVITWNYIFCTAPTPDEKIVEITGLMLNLWLLPLEHWMFAPTGYPEGPNLNIDMSQPPLYIWEAFFLEKKKKDHSIEKIYGVHLCGCGSTSEISVPRLTLNWAWHCCPSQTHKASNETGRQEPLAKFTVVWRS